MRLSQRGVWTALSTLPLLFWVLASPLMLCAVLLSLSMHDSLAKSKAPENFQVTVQVPSMKLESVTDFPAVKEIGGVRIELIPQASRTRRLVVQEVYSRRGFCFPSTNVPVTVKHTPTYEWDPKNVKFTLRITNHLGKLLRMEGVSLLFEVDGNAVPVDYTQNEVQKTMIPPEKSWEGTLQGPMIEKFFGAQGAATETPKHNGTFRVAIYDVVTEMDEASNPKKRSNFEWLYSYDASTSSEEGTGDVGNECMSPQLWSTLGGKHLVEPPTESAKPPQEKP